MNDANTYDARVRAIRAYNQPILDDFRAWLEQTGLAEKTIKNHVDNIDFFTEYLVYYEPLEKLDEADGSDVWMFLSDWFPRKAMWASEASVKSNSLNSCIVSIGVVHKIYLTSVQEASFSIYSSLGLKRHYQVLFYILGDWYSRNHFGPQF